MANHLIVKIWICDRCIVLVGKFMNSVMKLKIYGKWSFTCEYASSFINTMLPPGV